MSNRILTQHLQSGELRLIDAPVPERPVNGLLVQSLASLVSAGTERMLVDFGRANLLEKARSQPERVRDVIDKARTEGIAETVDAVRSKLAQPIPLGYANAGVVIATRPDVAGFAVGDVVASNGPHAAIVDVPATMAAAVPKGVEAAHACFASVASVGLEAIRLARCEIGERFVVSGLGLIGLITVQLLRAQGCAVLGIDPDAKRRMRAESFGASTAEPGDAAEAEAEAFSKGAGVDGVLVCTSTTSSDPVRAAARMSRRRGRVVLVGVTGLELDRAELYDKELSFQVSRAYGPGRYDPSYESGHDYPFGYVRWTAGRNMQAIVDLVEAGALDFEALITHRYDFAEASSAYSTLVDDRSALGIVLEYPDVAMPPQETRRSGLTSPQVDEASLATSAPGRRIAVIGAGNYATRTLIPAIEANGRTVNVIAARGGVTAAIAADRTNAEARSDIDGVLADPTVGPVFLATRHDSHARLAISAINAGKPVYVEKPLALSTSELDEIVAALEGLGPDSPVLTVGFNRRFAPITGRMKELLAQTPGPKTVIATVNAGAIPADHWTQDREIGGGRILGEGCHFIDLARHLVGEPITDVSTTYLDTATRDSATISLAFTDGSMATIHYLATGSARFPKERIEVFAGGRVLVNDNFKTLHPYGWKGVRTMRLRRQDKGHQRSVAAFLTAAAAGGAPPIPLAELFEVSAASIEAADTPT